MKSEHSRKLKREHVGQPNLDSDMALMDELIDALGKMVGIKQAQPDIENGSITYTRQIPDAEKIRKLYKNPKARPMIDKFFEIRGIDKKKFDIG